MIAFMLAAALALPTDGWASWEVDAGDNAPDWCCLQWRNKPAGRVACDLDGRNDGYGSTDRDDTVATMRIYARFTGGKLDRLRALGPQCEATTRAPVKDLGKVPPGESAAWLVSQLHESPRRLLDDTLMSLAVHRGATPTMIGLAKSNASPRVRAQSWFWLSQVRAPETESAVASTLRTEGDRHVREQAIFALSQLPGERGPKALADVVGDRTLPREDRKQAIFWMGQVESPSGTAYLDKLLNGR